MKGLGRSNPFRILGDFSQLNRILPALLPFFKEILFLLNVEYYNEVSTVSYLHPWVQYPIFQPSEDQNIGESHICTEDT